MVMLSDMPRLCEPEICSGCAACANACPHDAILMIEDLNGFCHPQIDQSRCVRCLLCEKSCPSLTGSPNARTPLDVYGAIADKWEIRHNASSGGVFPLLAIDILAQGGIVYGAAIQANGESVEHIGISAKEDLWRIMGSKYLQSNVGKCFRKVYESLQTGQKVLFSGTPCQVLGLRGYLKRDFSNLLCVEVICHGVPSPLAWRWYFKDRIKALRGRESDSHSSCVVSFRNKKFGWKKFSLSINIFGAYYIAPIGEDVFLRGFLCELFNRTSCHMCRARCLRSGSDITLGDFWNVGLRHPEWDDDGGTSLVLVNTEKGRNAYARIRSQVRDMRTTYEEAVAVNPALIQSPLPHPNRARFFDMAKDCQSDFSTVVLRMTSPTLLRRILGAPIRALRMLLK